MADDLGRTGRAKGSLSSCGIKEASSVDMATHCDGNVASQAEDYHLCKLLLRNGDGNEMDEMNNV